MPRQYVALDIETTGLDPQQDAIIEVAAIRFGENGSLAQFASLVNPNRPVPPKIVHLTGIEPGELQSAPAPWEVVRRLSRFVGNDPVVGHSVGFDVAFLSRFGALSGNRCIDTFELSTILMPHMARHSLQHLAEALVLGSGESHRALADAEAAMRLFLALQEAARALPPLILEQVVGLGRRSGWLQAAFFEDMLREQLQRPSGTSIGQQLFAKGLMEERPSLLSGNDGDDAPDLEPRRPPARLDVRALRADLDEGGAVAAAIPAHEHRPEQLDMLEAVAHAMNDGSHLVVEAGTGVGKSLAYLLPAIAYSATNRERIIISTYTINLQDQLYTKDIPQIADALGAPVRVSLLKGRNNYLCLTRLHAIANRPTLSAEQALGLAKIISWLPSTATGDRSELFLNTPAERHLWQQVCGDEAWCGGEQCPERRRGNCFSQRARAAAAKAHVVIVNHALLAADSGMETHILPEHEHLIVDEAHQLEGACTRALRLELTVEDLRQVLRDVVAHEKGTAAGPLTVLQNRPSLKKRPDSQEARDIAALAEAVDAMQPLLESLAAALDSWAAVVLPRARGGQRQGGEMRRITERDRGTPEWRHLVATWEPLSRLGRRAIALLGEVARAAPQMPGKPGSVDPAQALQAASRLLQEQVTAYDEVVAAPLPDNVYWLSTQDQTGAVVLNRVPISVGAHLREALFQEKRSVIMTSATLATDGSFDYFAGQVGLDEYRSLSVGSPFDYRRSTLVCIASDIPEPRHPGHQRAVEEAIAALGLATGGRLMALFTSNNQLRLTSKALTRTMEQEGILVYSQADGASRNQLLQGFKAAERAILLGTRSFWEGVDVPGEALECLVMVKIPFMVPDDPVVAARGERFGDSFNDYLLPEAILTFRQGFGRLIRTKSDRGVFVLLDSRVRSKPYGQRFLRSLPDCTFYEGPAASIPERALHWLNRERPK